MSRRQHMLYADRWVRPRHLDFVGQGSAIYTKFFAPFVGYNRALWLVSEGRS